MGKVSVYDKLKLDNDLLSIKMKEIDFIYLIKSKFSGNLDKNKKLYTEKGIEFPFVVELDSKRVGCMFLYFTINMHPSVVWLMYLRAYNPKMGFGSKMLSLLCEEADSQSVSLYIEPVPSNISEPIPIWKLKNWYRSFGFEGDVTMIRKPNAKQKHPLDVSF